MSEVMSCEVWYETRSQQPGSKLTQEASRAPCPMTAGFFQARQRSGQPSSPGSPWGVPSFHLCMQAAHHHPPPPHTAVSGCLCPHFSPAPSASVGLPLCRHPEGRWERRWYLHCGFSHVQVPGPSFLPLPTLLGALGGRGRTGEEASISITLPSCCPSRAAVLKHGLGQQHHLAFVRRLRGWGVGAGSKPSV